MVSHSSPQGHSPLCVFKLFHSPVTSALCNLIPCSHRRPPPPRTHTPSSTTRPASLLSSKEAVPIPNSVPVNRPLSYLEREYPLCTLCQFSPVCSIQLKPMDTTLRIFLGVCLMRLSPCSKIFLLILAVLI